MPIASSEFNRTDATENMGYEDRDYMQNNSGGGSSIMPGYPACRWLLFISVGFFIGQIIFTKAVNRSEVEQMSRQLQENSNRVLIDEETQSVVLDEAFAHMAPAKVSVLEEWFKLDTGRVLGGQVWRLTTYAFVHSRFGIWHIFVNLLLLYWFGRRIEEMYGSKELVAFYLFAATLAGLFFFGLQLWLGERIPAIGSSGAVMAIFCLYTMHHPYEEFHFRFLIPIQMRFLLLIYIAFDLHPLLLKLAGTPVFTGTAHAAHLGGLLFGFLYWQYDWHLTPLADRFLGFFSGSNQRGSLGDASDRSQPPGDSNVSTRASSREKRLEAELDQVLEKISASGIESLGEREKRILNHASERMKSRR